MRLLSLLLTFCLALSAARAADPAPLDTAAIDAVVGKAMGEHRIPGVALAITHRGVLRYAKGYGKANLEHELAMTPDTVVAIASVSKPLLALGVMRLVEQGKLAWSDSVSQHLPDTPPSWQGITLAHLASHTAGIVRESPAFDGEKLQADMALISASYPLPLVFPTGSKTQYCNVCYFALAEIITRRSGMPWPEFMRKTFFEPAGMQRTRTTSVSELVPGRAASYEWRDGRWLNQREFVALRPSGAFLSSALDLARFEAALTADRVVSSASLRQMETPIPLNDGSLARFAPAAQASALSWRVDEFKGWRRIWHGGSLAGFRTIYARYPDPGWAVILLSNGANTPIGALERSVAELLPGD